VSDSIQLLNFEITQRYGQYKYKAYIDPTVREGMWLNTHGGVSKIFRTDVKLVEKFCRPEQAIDYVIAYAQCKLDK
jgi:hypothetical protein